jgi:aspartate/methionine/tyrosine aminotransferase
MLYLLRSAVVEVLISIGVDFLSSDPIGATALYYIAAQCLYVRPQSRNFYSKDHKPKYYTNALALWKKFLLLGGFINVRNKKGAPLLFYYLSSPENNDYYYFENFPTYFSEEVVNNLNL